MTDSILTTNKKAAVKLPFIVYRKPPARQVVQKKAIADDVEIKTPFAIIVMRSGNCIKNKGRS